MKFEKNRYLVIMKELAERTGAVTSEELAKKAMVSPRTIKSDISYLNHLLADEQSAQIVSFKARGYQLKSLDDDRFKRLHEEVNIQYMLFQSHSIERINRQLYILQSLLTYKYVKLETVCDTLFVSRSALADDIAWATKFLLSYNLKVISVPGKGLHAEGLEQDIRSAMVEVFCSQYHDIELLYPVKGFSEFFYDDRKIYEDIRHAFLKMLRESKASVTDLASKKLATHLCLIRNRSLSGRHPKLSSKIAEELSETYHYQLAKEIFNQPLIHDYLQNPDESEILNFARLLIINSDVDMCENKDLEILPTSLMIENSNLFKEIAEELKQDTGGMLFSMELFRFCSGYLESMQMGLYLRHHFDHTCKQRVVTYNEGVEKQVSPIALEMARLIIQKTEIRFGEKISGGECKAYASGFDYILGKIEYSYKKQRLATVSTDSKAIAELMREEVNKHFGSYVEKNDVFELYEMRRINFEDYDAIVFSWGSLYLTYPLPFIKYGSPKTEPNHRQRMFRELFNKGFSRQRIEQIKSMVHCCEDFEISDYPSCLQALCFKYGKDDRSQKQLFDNLNARSEILSYCYSNSGVLLLFFDYCSTGREFIDFYKPVKTIYQNRSEEINCVIAVSMNPKLPVQDVKLTEKILQMLVNDRFLVRRLAESADTVLEEMFSRAVEEEFLQ